MPSIASQPLITRARDAGGTSQTAASRLFDLTDYFSGDVEGTGLFHDRFGRLRLGFEVTMSGRWEEDVYRLGEHFRYDDGRVQRREWRIRRPSVDTLTATAEDLVGTAEAKALPREVRWDYRMKVPIGERMISMRFDDRMYLRPDGTLLNVSTARKFGLAMGRLTAVFGRR